MINGDACPKIVANRNVVTKKCLNLLKTFLVLFQNVFSVRRNSLHFQIRDIWIF